MRAERSASPRTATGYWPGGVRRGLAAALVVAVGGCGNDPAAPVIPAVFDLVIETDRPQYSVADDSIAYISLTNRSNRAVHLPMDSYVVYERLRDGQWTDAYAWFVVDGIGISFPVLPGATVKNQLELWFYLRDRPGTYRLRYLVYEDPQLRVRLPLEERVSAPFIVAL